MFEKEIEELKDKNLERIKVHTFIDFDKVMKEIEAVELNKSTIVYTDGYRNYEVEYARKGKGYTIIKVIYDPHYVLRDSDKKELSVTKIKDRFTKIIKKDIKRLKEE